MGLSVCIEQGDNWLDLLYCVNWSLELLCELGEIVEQIQLLLYQRKFFYTLGHVDGRDYIIL